MRLLLVVACLLSSTAAFADEPDDDTDERPRGWFARAAPGFGWAFDQEGMCGIDGPALTGQYGVGYAPSPGVIVGLSAVISLNVLPETELCTGTEGRGAIGMIVGPSIEWYPLADRGAHGVAAFGYAGIDADDSRHPSGRGLGMLLGLGWDWRVRDERGVVRIGVEVQVAMYETFGGTTARHNAYAPAVLATFGFD